MRDAFMLTIAFRVIMRGAGMARKQGKKEELVGFGSDFYCRNFLADCGSGLPLQKQGGHSMGVCICVGITTAVKGSRAMMNICPSVTDM